MRSRRFVIAAIAAVAFAGAAACSDDASEEPTSPESETTEDVTPDEPETEETEPEEPTEEPEPETSEEETGGDAEASEDWVTLTTPLFSFEAPDIFGNVPTEQEAFNLIGIVGEDDLFDVLAQAGTREDLDGDVGADNAQDIVAAFAAELLANAEDASGVGEPEPTQLAGADEAYLLDFALPDDGLDIRGWMLVFEVGDEIGVLAVAATVDSYELYDGDAVLASVELG